MNSDGTAFCRPVLRGSCSALQGTASPMSHFPSFRASAYTGVGIRYPPPPSVREVSARSGDGGRDSAHPTAGHMGPALQSTAGMLTGRRPLQREALSLRTSDRVTGVAIRFPVAALVIQGGQRRSPLRSGTSGTPSPTHCVIARSTPRALASRREATRQSALPGTKKRIPAPVTRADRAVRPCVGSCRFLTN